MAGPFDLTGQNIENTYQRVLQTPDGATFYDGTGSLVTLPSADVSGLVTTSSFNAFTSSYNTGSFSGSFTGSLTGTATTASYYQETDPVFVAKSASLATTGSNIFIGNQTVTGSLFTTGSNTLIGITTLTGSLNITGSTTQTGNNTLIGNTLLTGSITISGSNPPGSVTASVQIYGDIRQSGYHRFDPVATNIDTSISASYIYVSGSTNDLYFSQNGSGYNNVTRLRWLEGNLYTGLLHGGTVSQVNSNTYQVASGSGVIVNLNASLTNDPYPTIQFLTWNNLTKTIDALSASYDQQFIAISSSGQIHAQGTPYFNGEVDRYIPVGIVLHQNRSSINGVKTQPSLAYGWKQRSNVFISAFGPLKLSGHALATSSSRGLTVGSGTSFADGANYPTDPNNPSYVTDSGTNVSKIFRYRQSGSNWVYDTNGGVGYTTINPTQYSLNGTLTGVANNSWSIQRVFWYPNSVSKAIVVYYGNAVYSTESEAIANINIEPFVEAPNTAANAIYLGAIIIKGDGTFTVDADFTILPGGLFRGVGGGGGGGTGTSITLKTNGTDNGSQTILNLKQGANVSLSDDGVGGITISSIGGGGGGNNTATGSYGSFYDTTIQSIGTVGAVYSMSLNNAPISNGVSLSGSTNPYNTYIKTENAGIYNIQFSAQLDKTTGTSGLAYIWLRKNGTDLPETNTAATLAGGANDKAIAAWNWFVSANAGDYFQLIWAATNNNIRLYATGSGAIDASPAIPSLIVTANRVDQFLSNTGSFSGSFTGSLLGTASWATNTQTALNGFPYSGSAVITGSLIVNDGNIIDTINTTQWALRDSGGITSVDWNNKILAGTRLRLNWDSALLYDSVENTSLDWESRVLYANDGTTAHLDWSNPSYMQLGGTTESPIVNVLGIDGGGRIYYTASSAIGGGSGGDFVPSSWTGSAASQFAGTASFVVSSSRAISSSFASTSSLAINALTASRLNADSTSIFGSGNRMTITASNGLIINAGNVGVDLQSKITVTGDILPGGPYINNTSSYSLGSSTQAWKDLYVSNGSVYFISGSNTASISFTNGNIDFGGTNVTIPSGSTVSTASFAVSASSANTASFAVSASFASTSSHSSTLGASLLQVAAGNLQLRSSNSTTISTINNFAASTAVTATSASFATTASFAASASHLNNGVSFAGPGNIITGSVAISASYGLLVPANTFTVGDIIKIQGVFTKPVSATNTQYYIYVNTSNQLSGATQMANYNSATTRWTPITRTFGIESSTRTTGYAAATSHYSDDIAIATGFATSSLNINWGVDQYILFAAQNATLADRTDTLRFFAKSI